MMKKPASIIILIGFTFIAISTLNAQGQRSNADPCMPCEQLLELNLPDVHITSAERVVENKPHCRIMGVIGSEIIFDLLLPDEWNGRYVMEGNGGFAGILQGDRSRVSEGYAIGGTNTGHDGNILRAHWALNHMERQLNFGHLAVHRTAVTSQEILRQYYGSPPEFSYFIGCSRGGGQAMMEAQRYPRDFDGIVAGAPAFNWPAIGAEFIQNTRIIYRDPDHLDQPILTTSNLKLLESIVLDQCDALDGLEDGILNDPRDCDLNFNLLPVCPDDTIGDECFTQDQIEAIKTVYSGVYVGNEEIYPGFPYGCESENGGWNPWIVGSAEWSQVSKVPSLHYAFGTEMFKYLIFQNPDWEYNTYDLSNFFKETRYASSYLDATSTNYTDFMEMGGKMIIYHGWNDPALSAFATVKHYEAAKSADQDIEAYIRLFLLPGVLHCGGGPGPDQTDWLGLVSDWVENGRAPERVILTKQQDHKEISRPVYPYPGISVYNGMGDPDQEGSFIKK
jgi:feruloyl esterase